MRDFYDILGVSKEASSREIKLAYRRLAMESHPDRNPDDADAQQRLQALNEAYEVLRDERKREAYDLLGREGLRSGPREAGYSSVEDIFEQFSDLFGDVFGFGDARAKPKAPPQDMVLELELSFEEAAFGAQRTITVTRQAWCTRCEGSGLGPGGQRVICPTCQGSGQVQHRQGLFAIQTTCPRCQGSGELVSSPCSPCDGQGVVEQPREVLVKIPGGVDEGTKLRIKHEGALSEPGQPRHDLFVLLRVRPHETFRREGLHLHRELSLCCFKAALGCDLELGGLDGQPLRLEVPAGAQHGDVLRLPGQGIKHPAKDRRGDLCVHLSLRVPTLTATQRAMLAPLVRQLDEARRDDS